MEMNNKNNNTNTNVCGNKTVIIDIIKALITISGNTSNNNN